METTDPKIEYIDEKIEAHEKGLSEIDSDDRLDTGLKKLKKKIYQYKIRRLKEDKAKLLTK